MSTEHAPICKVINTVEDNARVLKYDLINLLERLDSESNHLPLPTNLRNAIDEARIADLIDEMDVLMDLGKLNRGC